MMKLFEITVFAAIAIVLHVAFFLSAPSAGTQSSGAGGEAILSLAGANEQIAAMVQEWDRPPEVPDAVTEDTEPEPLVDITMPSVETAAQDNQPQVPLPSQPKPADAEDFAIDTKPAEPPVKKPPPAPVARPKARPVQPEPEKRSTTSRTNQRARAEERAAGAGGGTQAGQSTGTTTTISKGQATRLQAIWGAKIRSRIERKKRFPSGVRKSGRVVVALHISRSGKLLGYSVRRSSGSRALDQAALRAVSRAGRFPAAPSELTKPSYRFSLPIEFSR